ncbi:MAG TPA: hypothetical protein VNS88_15720, partial [Nitrospiraceae bacterium]|nr:hypothetical protein [Nitrospiraceae bacterium]
PATYRTQLVEIMNLFAGSNSAAMACPDSGVAAGESAGSGASFGREAWKTNWTVGDRLSIK